MYTLPKPVSAALILLGGFLFLFGGYTNTFSFNGALTVGGIILFYIGWIFAPANNTKEFIARAVITMMMLALIALLAFQFFI